MDKSVKLVFLNDANKNVIITIPKVKESITPEQIKEIMQYMVAENIIATKGGKLVKMIGAKVISTDTQTISVL